MHSVYLVQLYTVGIAVSTVDGTKTAKVILLQCSADLPARAQLTKMKQFNGHCACLYCYNAGTTSPNNPLHRFWPHSACSQRTSHSFIQDVIKATTTAKVVCSLYSIVLKIFMINPGIYYLRYN